MLPMLLVCGHEQRPRFCDDNKLPVDIDSCHCHWIQFRWIHRLHHHHLRVGVRVKCARPHRASPKLYSTSGETTSSNHKTNSAANVSGANAILYVTGRQHRVLGSNVSIVPVFAHQDHQPPLPFVQTVCAIFLLTWSLRSLSRPRGSKSCCLIESVNFHHAEQCHPLQRTSPSVSPDP